MIDWKSVDKTIQDIDTETIISFTATIATWGAYLFHDDMLTKNACVAIAQAELGTTRSISIDLNGVKSSANFICTKIELVDDNFTGSIGRVVASYRRLEQ